MATIKSIAVGLAVAMASFTGLSTKAGGSFFGGQWYPSCEYGTNNHGHGRFEYCTNGNRYFIKFQSGHYIHSYCGASTVYRSGAFTELEAAEFHNKVCSRAGRSSEHELMLEMMRIMSQQYQYF